MVDVSHKKGIFFEILLVGLLCRRLLFLLENNVMPKAIGFIHLVNYILFRIAMGFIDV